MGEYTEFAYRRILSALEGITCSFLNLFGMTRNDHREVAV